MSARFPYPPLRGDQVRAYHQLRLLGPKHRITLLSLTDSQVPPEALQTVEAYCERVVTLPLRRRQMATGLLRKIFSTHPLQTAIYQTLEMQNTVRHMLSTQAYDLAHIQLARMAPYLEDERSIPRVIDLIDALSLNMKRRFQRDRSPLKWMAYLEWKRLSRYERTICQMFDQVTVVSPVDYQAIGAYPNLVINANGVDLSKFSFATGEREPNSLIFSGNMGYFPNVNAVLWFAQHVLPLIKKTIPNIKLYVVGARPTREIKRLARQDPAIIVTGFVESVAAYLKQATVAVVPMQAGSGQQFKIIEAMACGTPVVATSYALGGIEATDSEHLLIANEVDAFAYQVTRLLQDQNLARCLAYNARRLAETKYTWERSVAELEKTYYSILSRSNRA
ncbi:glycosyltransferase family 4 protein [Chloroflexota bacterium]